ncbi:hypothetical protein V1478_011806 [Vespula squamosa]|uniref:Uncharacterized protein n=1 Tax=Vespula squamosa TaxID=30214 RepID=A0ABD2ABL0_VESSQ
MAQLARNPNKSNDLRAGKSIIRNDGQPEKEHEVTRREEVEKEKEEKKEGEWEKKEEKEEEGEGGGRRTRKTASFGIKYHGVLLNVEFT